MRSTAIRNSEEILEIANEIEKILEDNKVPYTNDAALTKIKMLCYRLKPLDHYVAEKASRLIGLAERYYSPRKHQKHYAGADGLYADMRYDLLSRIRDQADHIGSHAGQ